MPMEEPREIDGFKVYDECALGACRVEIYEDSLIVHPGDDYVSVIPLNVLRQLMYQRADRWVQSFLRKMKP